MATKYVNNEDTNSTVLVAEEDQYSKENKSTINNPNEPSGQTLSPIDSEGTYYYFGEDTDSLSPAQLYLSSGPYEHELDEDSIESEGHSSGGSHSFGEDSDKSNESTDVGLVDSIFNNRNDLDNLLADDYDENGDRRAAYFNRIGSLEIIDSELASMASDKYTNEMVENLTIAQMRGIEAIPYQFMPSVDTRISKNGLNITESSDIGRKYAEKIVSRMPLLFLTPCAQQAMSDFDKDDRNTIISALAGGDDVNDIVNGSGRYYTARFDYDTYYRYLNCMLASVTAFMGIYDMKCPLYMGTGKNKTKSVKLGEFDWSQELSDISKHFFSCAENVVFYLDGINSISENFSNNTGESAIANTINEASGIGQELKFLLGGEKGFVQNIITNAKNAASTIYSGLSSILGDIVGDSTMKSLIDSGVNALVSGGKIIFPKIWTGSDYSRSYSLQIKLRSPDHDPLSVFLNILKPYCKLLCLTLPRVYQSAGTLYDNNAYNSPFLVKAYCKGMFNIDMGIISSLSVEKGAESQWTDSGLPTQIDVTLEIEDLYSVLAMSGFESTGLIGNPFKASKVLTNIVNNTAYMDFLANMAGMNIAKEEIGRRATMWQLLANTATKQYLGRKGMEFDRKISGFLGGLFDSW